MEHTHQHSGIKCTDVVDFICTNFGEDEDSERCRAVRAHMKNCPDCTSYCDSVEKMIALYRSTAPTFPDSAKEELLSALGIRATGSGA